MLPMAKTLQVAADRAFDESKTILPAEYARGIYMQNPPSLRAMKLMHLLIAKAAGRMADDVKHELVLAEIRRVEGMAHHDRESLRGLFEELRSAVLTYDKVEAKQLHVGGLIDHAVIDYNGEEHGEVVAAWYFARLFRDMAANSNHWAIIDRQTVFHLTSKYSLLLFQHISSLTAMSRVSAKSFSVEDLRAVMGVEAGKMERFSNLNQRVLQPAIAEINQLSRFTLTANPKKVGRWVKSVEITWALKANVAPAKAELATSKVGRKARRDGTAEEMSQAFPATGSIRFTRWEPIARGVALHPMPDLELLTHKFRSFCDGRGISLSAVGIEKTFISWVSKFRVGY